ncbi:MAG: Zn-ribbon domain-containing OB-fold protein [Acidimicrobiia bacterium]
MAAFEHVPGTPPESVIELTPNEWTLPFWEATADHRLVVPRCTGCGAYRMPPGPFCHVCRMQDIEWVEQSGRGEVYSFTVIRHGVIPDVKEALPFVAAVVELPDTGGVRLVANIVQCEPEAVRIGMPVELFWNDVREGVSIPCFRPARGADDDG